MRDLAVIEQSILQLPKDASFERRLELRGAVDFAKDLLKELDRMANESLAEYLDEHGPQQVGDILWTFSRDKQVKPKLKPAELAERLVQVCGGDWGAFGGLLASGAFKHGACKDACEDAGTPQAFDEMFETVYKQTVEGKPAKSVKKIDTKFVRSASRASTLPSGQQ